LGFDYLPLTRSGERGFIDKYAKREVRYRGKREKTNMKAALPARDPRGDEDGVQRRRKKLNCINVRDGERIDTEADECVWRRSMVKV